MGSCGGRWRRSRTTDRKLLFRRANILDAARVKKIIITLVASYVVSLTQTNAGNSGSTPDKPSSLKTTGQLLEAERAGDIETIKMLLKNGFNINSKETPDGATALMWAAVQGDTDMLNLLLDKGGGRKCDE